VFAVAAPTTPFHAGELHRVAHESTAAIRNHGDDTLRMTIWYPAVVAATEKTIVVGSADAPVFVAGRAAADAPWADTSMHPLVVLSHGFGGSARQMTWLGAPLARAGYVGVAVDHPGTNGVDGVTPQGASPPAIRQAS
jgi:predicted dienelactone hydrolase